MPLIKKSLLSALALFALCTIANAQNIHSNKPQANYPPESWQFKVEFKRFPWDIACAETNGRGALTKRGTGNNVTYQLSGFPAADGLTCIVANNPKRRFTIDVDNLFGVGRTKRVMGGEYFEGEVKRVDLKVVYQSNAVGYGSYKAHAKRHTVFSKNRIIYSEQSMFAAFFPTRANQPPRRWKP